MNQIRSSEHESFDLDRDDTSIRVHESFKSGLRSMNQIRSSEHESFDLDRDDTSIRVHESFKSGLRSMNQIRSSEHGARIILFRSGLRCGFINNFYDFFIFVLNCGKHQTITVIKRKQRKKQVSIHKYKPLKKYSPCFSTVKI